VALRAVCKPLREGLREAGGADVGLRALDRICDAVEAGKPRVQIELEPRGPRVAVPRLADGTGIEKPAARGELDLFAVGRDSAFEVAVDRERDVAVADEDQRLRRRAEAEPRSLGGEHVSP